MFLYLSKLLPLLIYPVGLTCILMIIALVLLWRSPRLAAIPIVLGLVILMVAGNSQVAQELVRSLEWQNIPAGELPSGGAIVVLGGATRPQISPRPWVDVLESGDRILHGSMLYKQGKAPWLIMSGGRINWRGERSIPESEDMATIAEEMGVPAAAILQDPDSLNTYENAVNVKQILQDRDIQDPILLVTSAIHMPRSLKIFEKLEIEVIPAPTDFLISSEEVALIENNWREAILRLIPDAYAVERTTKAIKEYIGAWVYGLRGWI
ncbi:MAG: YdcF family protein [Arthrospira sp. SH-MAG29]|nr:YdcF family protein [Arthrospira sp. SH-MAG29]MBS0015634.1 YdcF family protein [Arthrospira sp. SH-MAG29]